MKKIKELKKLQDQSSISDIAKRRILAGQRVGVWSMTGCQFHGQALDCTDTDPEAY